jgi:hypothetical protein
MSVLSFLSKRVKLCYADYIAEEIRAHLDLAKYDTEPMVRDVGKVKSDLHPVGHYLVSTKKTLEVGDRNGRRYRVTVEEIDPPSKTPEWDNAENRCT